LAQDLKEINIITANDTSCSMYAQHVARELGLNAEAGLDVNLLSSDTTVPYVAFLSTGDAELVMLDSAQVLQMANAGEPGSVIYEVYQFAPDILAVLADSPIQKVEELRGKTIGLASDRDQITAIIALLSADIAIDEVSTAVVGDSGPLLAKALTDGTIDAFVGSTGDLAGINAAGVETRSITPAEVVENPGNSWVIWNPRKEELRTSAEGVLRAWAMAAHAGVLDTKTVKAICRKVIPEQWENPKSGHAMMDRTIYVTNLRRTVKFGELQPDVWARVQKPLIALGEIAGMIDPATFLDDSFIGPANNFTTGDVKRALAAWHEANPDAVIP
jgi:ABC-type nitrate/sulfonate/bicarbonate transport system substrate-binding protein